MPVAVITGASRGLGRALATELATRGWSLVAGRPRRARAHRRAAAALPGGPHRAVPGRRDRRRPTGAPWSTAADRLGGADLLVNNASTLGASPLPSFADLDPATYARVLEVNVVAPMALVRDAAARPARARRPGPRHHLRRVGRAVRDLGRLRIVQGRARPRHPDPRGRGAVAPGVRRRPRRHAHPDAPGRVPGRGHLRPTGARVRRCRRCCAWSPATCRAGATAPPTWRRCRHEPRHAGRSRLPRCPTQFEATVPPEARGLARDEVRMAVVASGRHLPRPASGRCPTSSAPATWSW